MKQRSTAVVQSALWAAYGDALGYMTELADEAKVRRRTGLPRVGRLQEWTRDLPGRPPVSVRFPAGTYSDDTQLRLATGRAIRADGRFNVAAFAKVELPSWTNYALGAGISSKEAAFSLGKASTQWYSNFFETARANYRHGGGNGAAMRIQPHVWATSPNAKPDVFLNDVIRNAICTHGHPRGILGAAFHAISLHFCLEEGRAATVSELHQLTDYLDICWELVESDADLRLFWLPQAQKVDESGTRDAFRQTLVELHEDIEALRTLGDLNSGATYRAGLERINLFDPKSRGSGTKTAVAAAWLAWRFKDIGPQAAMVEAANALGSDTDTIATMAGALMGSVASEGPPERVQDSEYLVHEAERLVEVSARTATHSFGYPDLRSYKPPKSAVDAVLAEGDSYVVAGLGHATPVTRFLTHGEKSGDLRWLKLQSGQTILAHIRQTPKQAAEAGQSLFEPPRNIADERRPAATGGLKPSTPNGVVPPRSTVSVDELATAVIAAGHDPKELGMAILRLSDGPDSHYLERVASLAVIVSRSFRATRKIRSIR